MIITMINWARENLQTIIGMSLPGGLSMYSCLTKATTVLTVIGLMVTIAVGISAFLLNLKKREALNKELKDK